MNEKGYEKILLNSMWFSYFKYWRNVIIRRNIFSRNIFLFLSISLLAIYIPKSKKKKKKIKIKIKAFCYAFEVHAGLLELMSDSP